jgi:hypothetical protein
MVNNSTIKCSTTRYYYTSASKQTYNLMFWFHNLASDNYFLLSQLNFKLYFIIWVFSINTHIKHPV